MTASRIVAALLCTFLAGIAMGDGAESCSAFSIDVPIAEVVASSAFVPNLIGTSNSLRSESSRLLAEACNGISEAEPPVGLCPEHCQAPDTPVVVLRSTPTAFLENYQGQDRCEQQLETTSRTPLAFERQVFGSSEELGEWVEGFVRGKGDHGEDLYARCDGKCSPQYLWVISRGAPDGDFVVDTRVTCGHARDRAVNEYALSYELRWTCRNGAPGRQKDAIGRLADAPDLPK